MLGLVDVGCRDDISEAFDVARNLVDPLCAYGFDAYELGSSTEVLRQKKEQLIANEIAKCYQQAKKILIENRMFLDKTIEALLEKKTLTQKDIKEIRDRML